MKRMQHYVPIADYKGLLQEQQQCLNAPYLKRLAAFLGAKERLEESLQELDLQQEFQQRLLNFQSIETGQIEGLYNLSSGITEVLIQKGFAGAQLEHFDAGGQDPEVIVKQLQDQKAALEGLFAFIKNETPFSLAYIRELHRKLCAHQSHTYGKDSLGTSVQIELVKGAWKENPNNPRRDDGSMFYYCPVGKVQSEMMAWQEALCSDLQEQSTEAKATEAKALVSAAWLHHRFSMIHPFQDGNGRMARLLASLWLIRAGLYPFIVPRADRTPYLDSLEAADRGELGQLLLFMLKMQKQLLNDGQKVCEPHLWQLVANQIAKGLKEKEFLQADWRYHPELQQWAGKHLKDLIEETVEYTTKGLPSFKTFTSQKISYSMDKESKRNIQVLGHCFIAAFHNADMKDKKVFVLFIPSQQDGSAIYKVLYCQNPVTVYHDYSSLSIGPDELSLGEWSLEQLQSGVADTDFRHLALRMLKGKQ